MDIGLVYGPVLDPGVIVEALSESAVVCAVHSRSRLATHEVLEPRHLETVAVVTTAPTTRIGVGLKEACEAHGLTVPKVAVEVNSSLAAYLMVAEEVGVGLVDPAAVNQYALPNVVLRPFHPRVVLHLCLIFPKDRPQSRVTMRFAQALRKVVAAG